MSVAPGALILDDAGIYLGDGAATEVFGEVSCFANHLELSPDTSVTTLDTMCGSVDLPGSTKWSLLLTLYQSYLADGTDPILSAAVEAGTDVGFKIVPRKSDTISATNPIYVGKVRPQPYAPVNGDAGDASTIEIEWGVTEGPTKEETGTLPASMAATATAAKK